MPTATNPAFCIRKTTPLAACYRLLLEKARERRERQAQMAVENTADSSADNLYTKLRQVKDTFWETQ